MRERNRENKAGLGKVITGLVVGGIVGAAVGLLMAPTSGEEIRNKIIDEARGAQKKAKAAVGNIEDKGREIAEDVKENAENVRESIIERVTRRVKNA